MTQNQPFTQEFDDILKSNDDIEDLGPMFVAELTDVGEQFVIPGCERELTETNPQGRLF